MTLHDAHSALQDTKTDPAGRIGFVLTGPKAGSLKGDDTGLNLLG